MNKESMLFRTHEIKSNLLTTKCTNPVESLIFYIKDNNYQKFKEIAEKYKSNPESKDAEGNTLLNLAVQCHSFPITNYLLEIGAEVNTQNVYMYIYLEKIKYPSASCIDT